MSENSYYIGVTITQAQVFPVLAYRLSRPEQLAIFMGDITEKAFPVLTHPTTSELAFAVNGESLPIHPAVYAQIVDIENHPNTDADFDLIYPTESEKLTKQALIVSTYETAIGLGEPPTIRVRDLVPASLGASKTYAEMDALGWFPDPNI